MLNPQTQVWPQYVAKTQYKAALGLWVFLPAVPYHPPLMLALALQFWVALVSRVQGFLAEPLAPVLEFSATARTCLLTSESVFLGRAIQGQESRALAAKLGLAALARLV